MATESTKKAAAGPLTKFAQWMAPKKKYVYDFQEGNEGDKSFLGAKAAILCEMTKMNIPVPSGFVLSNEACQDYLSDSKTLSKSMKEEIAKHIHKLEKETGQLFGTSYSSSPTLVGPLLLSIRVSSNWEGLPGLTDTVLNLGMNETIVHAMAASTGCPRFAFDTYRRFLQTYATHVLGVDVSKYENIMATVMKKKGCTSEQELTTYDLQGIITKYNEIATVPSDCWQQLYENIEIIYNSYESPAASLFRESHCISHKSCSPGVIIQSMVYGNRNSNSGTGIFATRNPCTGQKTMTGEFIQESEGEDMVNIVASAATTASISPLKQPVAKKKRTDPKLPASEEEPSSNLSSSSAMTAGINAAQEHTLHSQTILSMGEFQLKWPKVYDALQTIANKLEYSFKDIQDIEFTVQDNNLFILEARSARRSAKAAVKVCVDMVQEQVITEREAMLRIDPMKCMIFEEARMFAPPKGVIQTDEGSSEMAVVNTLFGRGSVLSAAGVASGVIVFTEEQLKKANNTRTGTILVVDGTQQNTDAISLIKMSNGVLISNGHLSTCVPAIQARDLGKCAISFTEKDNKIFADFEKMTLQSIAGCTLKQGAMISIDGFTGNIANGEVDTVSARMDMDYQIIMSWAKEYKRLAIVTTVKDMDEIDVSQVQDAEGIGQCRTENMFHNVDCKTLTCAMMLTDSHKDRNDLLDKILPHHQADILKVYRAFPRKQISFRLLDVPLNCLIHDIAPVSTCSSGETSSKMAFDYKHEIQSLSETLGLAIAETKDKLEEATKTTPLLGLRGSRLSVLYPEVTAMQTKAIIGASIQAAKEGTLFVKEGTSSLEICIPLVCSDHEVEYLAPMINAVAKQVMKQENFEVSYGLCTSFDVPRACMRAESIATEGHVNTVIFNTDMITQLVYGFPRGDVNRFLSTYVKKHILTNNPFESIDRRGVGAMLELAISKIRKANPKIRIGICGSHGGDPSSVRFFNNLNVDFISVPPRRLAIATISAAKSQITYTANANINKMNEYIALYGAPFYL